MVGFAEIAALITVGATTIYVLGLVALAWSIHERWNNDAFTTWYALSLIPRTVVAGQGMRLFIGLPTYFTVLVCLWWLYDLFVYFLSETLKPMSGTAYTILQWGAVLVLFVGYAWLLGKNIGSRLSYKPENPRYRWLIFIIVVLSVPLFLGIYVVKVFAIQRQEEFPFFTVDWSLLLVAILLLFVWAFFVQLSDATAINPPLPTVEIALSDANQTVLEGKLLTHTEGVVYFFDEHHKLTSMPDSKITSVRVREEKRRNGDT
jgi:hypothetical protein